ncbi:MAG TPA: winged helix-turn-helix domain-containing protein [Syntrophomonadaceae bacterium]|nr:winged helix-turn-helix domain-containing protein [Syntrophomonadaceae bacterium]
MVKQIREWNTDWGYFIDLSRRLVKLAGAEVHLTPTEYDLLKILAANASKVVTHRKMIKPVGE